MEKKKKKKRRINIKLKSLFSFVFFFFLASLPRFSLSLSLYAPPDMGPIATRSATASKAPRHDLHDPVPRVPLLYVNAQVRRGEDFAFFRIKTKKEKKKPSIDRSKHCSFPELCFHAAHVLFHS